MPNDISELAQLGLSEIDGELQVKSTGDGLATQYVATGWIKLSMSHSESRAEISIVASDFDSLCESLLPIIQDRVRVLDMVRFEEFVEYAMLFADENPVYFYQDYTCYAGNLAFTTLEYAIVGE